MDIGSDHTDLPHTDWHRMDSVVRSHCTEALAAAHLEGIAPFGIAYSAAGRHPQVAVQVRRAIHVRIVAGWQLATHRAIFGLVDLTILRL